MAYKYNKLQRNWLRALKSGKYRQTKGQLVQPDRSKHAKYCCLGVACEVASRTGAVDLERKRLTLSVSYDDCDVTLPPNMKDALKLFNEAGKLDVDPREFEGMEKQSIVTLTGLNDTLGWSFKKIAAYIEENPNKVFAS